ncbi:hypothetical protein PAMP_022811 [Pampus punctatissimus]
MEASILDDDMVEGDLGNGMRVRAAPSSIKKKSQSSAGVIGTVLSGAELLRCSSQGGEAAWIPRLRIAERQLPRNAGSLVDMSKDELKDRLQEASEAILDKATSHTKSLLQKSEEMAKALEKLAVLGPCRCFSVTEACPCSQTAAATRKQLVQLQQELDAQHLRREEALMVADAFRIAFEQQLRKRSEHFLLLAEANILKSHHCKPESKSDISTSHYRLIRSVVDSVADFLIKLYSILFIGTIRTICPFIPGANRSPLISVSQRLRGLLPSSLEMKMPDDLLETLYRLLDLLNDKEEALAHQRKVSIMLAHSAEELQRQLHLDSHYRPPEPSEFRIPSKQPQEPSENKSQPQQTSDSSESNIQPPILSESNIQAQQQLELSDSLLQSGQPAQELSQPNSQPVSNHNTHQSEIQQSNLS